MRYTHLYSLNTLLRLCLWLIAVSGTTTLSAQDISFNYLSTENGLSQFSVYALHKDELGRIWIGTRDGLNVYDGNRIQYYKYDKEDEHSLVGNQIRNICGNDKGMLYVQTSEGLCEFDMYSEKFHTIQKGGVYNITYGADTLFTGGNWQVNYYDPKSRELKPYCSLDVHQLIVSLLKDDDGNLWMGTRKGLYCLKKGHSVPECVLSQIHVYNLYQDTSGDMWICTWEDGLFHLSDSGIAHYTDGRKTGKEELSSNSVRDCCEDNQGNMWIATFNGLDKFDKKTRKFTCYAPSDVPGSLSNSSVYCIIKDHQGTMWVGTYFGGANYFNPEYEIYTYYRPGKNESEGLTYPVIGCMAEDKRGNIWIASEGGGLNYYNRKTKQFKWYKHKEGENSLSSNNIKSLYYDSQEDVLWIGTHQEGFNKLDIKTDRITRYRMPDSRSENSSNVVLDIIPYGQDILLASYGGVFLFNPRTEKFSLLLELFSNSLYLDSQGILWVAVEGSGVYAYHFDTKELINYRYSPEAENSISYSRVNTIIEDRHHNMWFSTSGSGIDVFYRETGKFENFNARNNKLGSDCVYSIVESQNGKLLLTTNQGFTIFDYYTKVFNNHSAESGFPFTTLNEKSLYQCKDGEIFLGGVKGMISFYEKDLDIPLKPYSIIPVRLWVNGDEVGINDETGILQSSLYDASSITLKSNHSVLSIEFAMTNYIAANKNELVYKLEGFSNEWAQTHGQKMITYTNLPAGDYTLIVKTVGANHVYQSECRLAITVLPPFYKTGWAYLLYVIVIAVILFYLIKAYRDRIRLQESLKYEQQHIRDVEELNQSKLRFFTNISHEFRTPLTIIIGQIEMLLQGQSFSPAAYNKLLNIYKNGLQLRELISELLDFRKQEQGHMKIKVSRHELLDFLYENYLLYVEYAATCNIHFHFDKGEEHLEVWYDSRQLQKVINNLLSNAFKYTPKGGTISLNVYKKGEEAVIEVRDSGTGISPEEIEKIFERFYQVGADSGNIQGTGIGLALSKGIIELHKGRIEVSSHLDKGTTFTIYLKLGKEHFLEEQIDTEPVKEEPLSMPAEPQLQLEQQVMDEDVQNRIKGAKMLIVEDNTSLREMLAGLFEPYYEVVTASDGEEGLQKAQEVMPDIIISDIMMPKMTGIELCKQIKANFETCHIPVVLLTARIAIEHTIEGLRIGADDYITKPFNVNLLISRCNNLVNSRRVLQEKFGKQPQTQVQMLATNPMDKDLLDRTVAIIEKNLDNSEYSLSDLIKELYISRTNFFTKIKAITGQTPNEFILTIRLKKAAWLLKHEQYLSVTEVADRTGFSSQRYFSRCFKDMYGISPLYYRTGNKEDNQEE
ncbi:hybrid sensor histidine kinase/response regulator transcription factor [Bacteroides congonensis]|uniref:hybrid sensor histidine kinase/response regulator transcription factor n=1 Tax=Bacteroides congonensis TaxID=1871006 RepID=UPI002FD8E0C2